MDWHLWLDKLTQWLGSPPGMAAAAGAAALVVLLVIWRMFRGGKRQPSMPQVNLTINVASLGDQGPPEESPFLEFYNMPVRLAAVVLAPAGRVRELPPPEQLDGLFDSIVPGLSRIVQSHQPLVRRWPGQLSVRGFAHTLFSNARLSGEGGKGTCWSSVAGTFRVGRTPVMAGLIVRARGPNNFGQLIIDSEEKWLGCFRVKDSL